MLRVILLIINTLELFVTRVLQLLRLGLIAHTQFEQDIALISSSHVFKITLINKPEIHLDMKILISLLLLISLSNVEAAPAFTIKDIAGKTHHLCDYKGKWVLVNYWATWCPPCLEEIPDLVSLYDYHKDKDLMVIGVAFEYKDAKEVTDFVDDMLMSYPIVLGDEPAQKSELIKDVGSAVVLPTTYIYDPQGRLVKIKRGLITKFEIEKLLLTNKP